jgi:hypothetical protein
VNDGKLVVVAATNEVRVAADVVTNGEMVGSAASDASVSTVRVGDGVSILWNTVYRNSASSSAS